jgi:hypothetical protein
MSEKISGQVNPAPGADSDNFCVFQLDDGVPDHLEMARCDAPPPGSRRVLGPASRNECERYLAQIG